MADGYPEYMRKSIEKLESTREERAKINFERMHADESDKLLKKYHPDYREEGKQELKIGASKGEKVPLELLALLEAPSLIEPSDVDLTQIDFDVDLLIIGGGGAGTVAALWAIKEGIPVENILIATKLRHGDSNSMMAQGGIQAADKKVDSPVQHYLDAMGGGHYTNEPDLLEVLTTEAPKLIRWHEELGILYDRDEEGEFIELPGGGTSRYRMHSSGDYTGMELMRTIRDEARNKEVPVLEFAPAVELLTDDSGKVTGALLMNLETNEYYVVRAKSTIMATGGFGRLHVQSYPTSNHYGATGDGLILGYRAGVPLKDMDSVQYHPTGAAFPEQVLGLLVTEKVRSIGAQPVNVDGELFVNPLEPRDVEAAAFIRECYGRDKGIETPTGMKGVWLDSPLIDYLKGEGTVAKSLPAMVRQYKRFGIDMTKDPILVFPTLHYQNGGLNIDKHGATPVEGLYACGEVTGGVHGKNRLMGNSLLDFNVFGKRSGISAATHAKKTESGKLTLGHLERYNKSLKDAGITNKHGSPLLLPEYRGKKVLERHLDVEVTL